jgi:SAM-dependent methyltransferase
MYDLPMLFLLALVLFLGIGLPGLLFAPWVPTRRRDFDRIDFCMGIEPSMTVMDLGSGTGSVIFELAKRHPEAKFIGVELSFVWYGISVIRNLFHSRKNVSFRLGNLLTTDIRSADRIYLFGTPAGLTQRLKKKFQTEAKIDARIISYCFELTGWKSELRLESKEKLLPVFRYQIPK